eukprot:UN06920
MDFTITADYFEESIDKAMMEHHREESRMKSLEVDLGLLFNSDDAQLIATETISEISQNPRALFERKQTLIDRIEKKLNVNLNSMIEQAINIKAMHKPQSFDDMTFNAKDLKDISNDVIKQIHKTTKNYKDEDYLQKKIDELNEELEYVNQEIDELKAQIQSLTTSKMQTAINCNKNMNQMRMYLLKCSQNVTK